MRTPCRCGGTCQYLGHSGGCIIKLSEPLLKVTYVLDDHRSPSPKLCLAGMLRMRSGLLSCADVIYLVTQFRPVKDLKVRKCRAIAPRLAAAGFALDSCVALDDRLDT